MIPSSTNIELSNYEIQPSLTYKLDLENKRIMGKVNNSDSVFQAIQKILSTDKYAYDIYDWNYGHELLKLVGKEFSYIEVKLPQIINEALLQDDRIEGAVKMGNSWNIPILLLQRARHKVSAEIHDVSMHPGPKYDLLLQVQPLTAAIIAEYRSVRPEIG